MLKQEFTTRTGITPTTEEYERIEQEYYSFNGSKDEYCKAFVKDIITFCNERGKTIEQMRSKALELDKMYRMDGEKKDKEIERLTAELDKELEWEPYEDEHNVKQTDYEQLAADSDTRELTDEEAADLIANEFGFDRSKIVIVHEVVKLEINRHRRCRKVGTIPRKALFNVWDWNYIVFNIKGNTTMGYEMYNGELQMYWS